MNRFMVAVILVIGLTSCGRVRHENGKQVALPNSKLIRCRSLSCAQLWQENPAGANAVYPSQLSIDIQSSCPTGIVARYDGNISIQEIKAAIDQRYAKWAAAANDDASVPVKLWRVEPERFAIQLVTVDKEVEAMTLGQALAQPLGQQEKRRLTQETAKQVIYLSFDSKCED